MTHLIGALTIVRVDDAKSISTSHGTGLDEETAR